MCSLDGRRRTVIERVAPEIDGGLFPIKRRCGEVVVVEADVFTDGHDKISSDLLYRSASQRSWERVRMRPLLNDRWRGEFTVDRIGRYAYTVESWVDRFASWRYELMNRRDPQDISVALVQGSVLLRRAAERAPSPERERLEHLAEQLSSEASPALDRRRLVEDEVLGRIMYLYDARLHATRYFRELPVVVDRERARFSAWYELFPRSCAPEPERHGTLKDCESRLEYVRDLGFDVIYFPPIHPIGRTRRKGPNNSLTASPRDPGSPWAIGAQEGGHKAVHPHLGTLEDFDRLVAKAESLEMQVALDIALQCSPDHPYVEEHPSWFSWRPDGKVQYAENPPKKYEDIYPFNFETDDWQELWGELKSIFAFWIEHGVSIFRVDNPHTKPFSFWEWCIRELKRDHPELIFLSEAFSRPKIMYRLAKIGFTQSYTYFAWRTTKWELTQYVHELTQTELREYFQPNFWSNTPDILTEYLQLGGRPAFMARVVLAATLSPSYGIYGPAFELCENRPREPGTEEYLDSEKYQIRHWDLTRPDSLAPFIKRLNRIRRENPALQMGWNTRFFPIDNDHLICYGRWTDDSSNILVVVVNLDPHHTQSGWVELPLADLHLDPHRPYQMHDLLSDARYLWNGPHNYVELRPDEVPAQVFRVRKRVRTEHDFEYFM